MIGTTLSHYKILDELGRGGMGIVYKAEDTKLDRIVAIKVLPAAALANADDRERFYREAKAAAQLHHPHIASVFEIDEAVPSDAPHGTSPSPFIAMEFVDGGTLKDEIDRGPMKLKEAVRTAAQVAEALKLAHSKEIVHRDIKSHNVMLTKEGDAKVLDFGLAKTAQSTMLTRMGSTLGTVAYMSPEQARGENVDHRSDIWSLGVMLFEMVAGRLPFAGEYEKAVMYGILNEMPPPLTSLRTGVPMGLEWIVSKCLSKDPNERYQACADLIVDLKTVDLSASGLSRQSASSASVAGMAGAGEQRSRSLPLQWLSVLLLPLGLVLGWFLFRDAGSTATSAAPTRMFEFTVEGATDFGSVAATHDGTKLVGTLIELNGNASIVRLDLRTGEVSTIVPEMGTGSLSISWDDEWVAFQNAGSFYRVRLDGGTPVPLMENAVRFDGSTWLPDGSIIVSKADDLGRSIWRLSATGSEPELVARPDSAQRQTNLSLPISLGERPHILVEAGYGPGRSDIVAIDLENGRQTSLGAGSPVAYVNSGHLVYFESPVAGSRLYVRPFDADRLEWLGQPVTLEENADPWTLAVDPSGVYYSETLRSERSGAVVEARLYVNGAVERTILDDLPQEPYQPRLSWDGSRVMLRVNNDDHEELHAYDLETGVMSLFTNPDEGDADNAAWSPDDRELIFEMNDRIYRRNANGSGATVEIPTEAGTGALDWSRSGDLIVHTAQNLNGWADLYRIDLATGESVKLDAGPGRHGWPRISPDNRFISYATLSSTGRGVWVLSLEDGNRTKVADVEGVQFTAWARDGKSLYYLGSEGLFRVPVTLDPYFERVGRDELIIGEGILEFDLVSDGDSIFAIVSPFANLEEVGVTYSVITDWQSELQKIAPAVRDR